MSRLIVQPHVVDEALAGLWAEAWGPPGRVRGLSEIAEQLEGVEAYVERLAAYAVLEDVGTVALGIVEERIIKFLYVTPSQRRRGLARELVGHLVLVGGARDAWALPGDRASKSLYESLGWRARLLTMRGE